MLILRPFVKLLSLGKRNFELIKMQIFLNLSTTVSVSYSRSLENNSL